MGSCPQWYELIHTAKYMGVAPWDLLERNPVWWRWGRDAEAAEAYAQEQKKSKRPITSQPAQ